jgi:hypothetical protein
MKIRFSGHLVLAIAVLGLVWPPPVHSQTYTVLYNFGTNSGDPIEPQYAGVITQGRDVLTWNVLLVFLSHADTRASPPPAPESLPACLQNGLGHFFRRLPLTPAFH